MDDNLDHLFDAPVKCSVTPEAASPIMATPYVMMPDFTSGKRVHYLNVGYTVSHVVLSKGHLLVHLQELDMVVSAENLVADMTRYSLVRT